MARDYRVLVASDSFKGSATSERVNRLIARGVKRVCPTAQVDCVPIADGGEGTVAALTSALGGTLRHVRVEGPLGQPVEVSYGLLPGDAVVIEMSAAAGITQTSRSEEDALHASTFGVGQLLLDALDQGARTIYMGLGGSATSDGGAGMAEALGARMLGVDGEPVERGLAGLRDLATIDLRALDLRVRLAKIVLLTDVTNPLCGLTGAIRTYGAQKGLPERRFGELDAWMVRYAGLVDHATHSNASGLPGSGAAGGLGFGMVAFCGARIQRGIETVLDAIDFNRRLRGVDLVITGEGRMDAQTAQGKAPVGVARRARAHGISVVAVVGGRAADLGGVWGQGIGLVIPTVIEPMSLTEAINRTEVLLPLAGESAMRAFLLGGR